MHTLKHSFFCHLFSLFPAIILLTAVPGCNNHPSLAENSEQTNPTAESGTTVDTAGSNNIFAWKLYHQLVADKDSNIFFSPFSISSALTMTWAGAKGKTADEMADVLHLQSEADTVHRKYRKLFESMREREEEADYELIVANALWGQEGTDFRDEFMTTVQKFYYAAFNEVNYKTDAEGARKRINQWVAEKTRDKIEELIPSGVLDGLTRLVLTNAVYFKAPWQNTFSEELTRDRTFTQLDGQDVEVPMMHQTESFGYTEAEECKVLEIPYDNNDFTMVIILPRNPDGLPALEKELSHEDFGKLLNEAARTRVKVAIPKFKTTSRFQLAKTLQDLGMHAAFAPRTADFSAISRDEEDLFLQDVLHKSYIDVDEKGTEAAAATGVVMRTTAAHPEDPEEFTADHPFLFLIRDQHSDNILFMGRVVNLDEN